MYRLKEDHLAEFEIKKSRFICYLHRCNQEEDAKAFIAHIKKQHSNATHHCYAMIIGDQNEIQRSNDDGEPSGTAGVPMLECLMHHQIQDIIAVTVRYYGGIKLGAGGLIRAYAKSVSIALHTAKITKKEHMQTYALSFSYAFIGKLDYYFRQNNITIIDKQFDEWVCYTFLSKHNIDQDISELTNGLFVPDFINDVIIDVDVLS